MEWLEVILHDEEFSEKPLNFNGTIVGIGTGKKVFRCHADAAATCSEALDADDGEDHVTELDESFSEDRPGAAVTSRQAKHINNSPRDFEVTVDFADLTGGMPDEDLLALPPIVTSAPMNGTEEYVMDVDGNPVTSKSGEPFDQAPTRLTSGRIYTITAYVTDATKAIIRAAERSTNNDPLVIDDVLHDTDTLLLTSATFEPVKSFNKVTMQVQYNENRWVDTQLNVSFSQIVDGKLQDCTQLDKAGDEVQATRPRPLDADGKQFTSDLTPPTTLFFYPYRKQSWDGVPIA